MLNLLKERNEPDNGVHFIDLISHFVVAGDEACLMASAKGVNIFGCRLKKKHEKNTNDSRDAVTVLRTGSTAGATGPTVFLSKGAKVKDGYTNKWLTDNGAAPGSRIIATPNAFMTMEAWEEMAEPVAKGIRAMPVIRDHPNWWLIYILDGFVCHFGSPKALDVYYKNKILLVKEEGDTSHVCQIYDQLPAKQDKAECKFWLDKLRHIASLTKGVVDQWILIAIALQAVRAGTPDMWINSAKRVNLHPDFRRPFMIYMQEIAHFLVAGQTFKMETYSNDIYPLLPPLWHSMLPAEKRTVMSIMDRHGGLFTVNCVNELFFNARVMHKDMQKLRICVDAAKANPLHLDMGMPLEDSRSHVCPEVVAAVAAMAPATQGLVTFQLKPAGLKGVALFEHMLTFRTRFAEDPATISIDVEMTDDQRRIIAPTDQELTMRAILKDAGGIGAMKKLARRTLNNTGAITNHCGLMNHPERISKLMSALQLASSIAQIHAGTTVAKQVAKKNADFALMSTAYPALMKLKLKANNVSAISKKDICAISFRYFLTMLKEADTKIMLVKALEGLILARPSILLEAMAQPNNLPDVIPVVPYASAASSDEESNEDEEGTEYA